MPWQEVKPMDQKVLFIADWLRQARSFSDLCAQYTISRKTGYKWIERYRQAGAEGLYDASRKHNDKFYSFTDCTLQNLKSGSTDLIDTPAPRAHQGHGHGYRRLPASDRLNVMISCIWLHYMQK